MPWPDVADAHSAIRTLCPKPAALTLETHDQALGIASRYGFHIDDALIVADALQTGCRELYPEDLQDGQVVDGRPTIRNPLLHE